MVTMGLLERTLSPAPLESNPGLCLRLRHKKSGCQLCRDNCPTNAISIDESLHVERARCHGCGICVNVCPTGVFELKQLCYEELLGQVEAGATPGFTCSLWPQEETSLPVPCIGYLNEAVFIGMAASGSNSAELNLSHCKNCDYATGMATITKSLERTNHILSMFSPPREVRTRIIKTDHSYTPDENRSYSRREFFTHLREEIQSRGEAAIEVLSDNQKVAVNTRVMLEPRLPKKRRLLLRQMEKLGTAATTQARADKLPFAEVQINDDCNGCRMCATFCPTGALRTYDDNGKQVIDFATAHCLACNLCADICPKGALTYAVDVRLQDILSGTRRKVAVHEKATCARCGQGYIDVAGDTWCPPCRKKEVRW